MEIFVLLALFSGIAVSACLFIAGYFFLVNNERLIQRVLGLLFLAIALRIGKSVFYYLIPDMSLLGISLGFLGLSTIGPWLWLYVGLSNESRLTINKTDLIHLVLPFVGFTGIVSGSNLITPSMAYLSGTVVLFLYLLMCWRLARYSPAQRKEWNRWLIGSTTLIWGAFAYQLVSESILNYAYGAGMAALVAYLLIFKMLRKPTIFQKKLTYHIGAELIQRLVKCLEDEHYYQKPALNLSQFAQHLGEPAYLVSKAVKRHYGRTFPEVVNALRIKEVTRRLQHERYEFNKVEGMAYDVGFNTPSAFYAAFKKETSSSPREYQRSLVQ
ncbi:MAG: AraC family transcriptional regulator [Cyclobacteriaceae bacterium]